MTMPTATEQLLDAASTGELASARAALRCGANIHAQHDDALYYACSNGHARMVEFLIAEGADVHVAFEACLVVAVESRDAAVTELLIGAGAEVETARESGLLPEAHAFLDACVQRCIARTVAEEASATVASDEPQHSGIGL